MENKIIFAQKLDVAAFLELNNYRFLHDKEHFQGNI